MAGKEPIGELDGTWAALLIHHKERRKVVKRVGEIERILRTGI